MKTEGVHAALIMDLVGHDISTPVMGGHDIGIPFLKNLLFITGTETLDFETSQLKSILGIAYTPLGVIFQWRNTKGLPSANHAISPLPAL